MASDRRQFLQGAGMAIAGGAVTVADSEHSAQPQPAPPAPPKPIVPPRPRIRVDSVAATIEKSATSKMRRRLGLGPTDPIPKEVLTLIREQATAVAGTAVELGASRDAQAAAREFGRAVTVEDFQEKLSAARNGIQVIGKSQDVDTILRERATMLWKKKTALEAAGFSTAEAMQIVLADIAARGN